jgi:hypothetical protein
MSEPRDEELSRIYRDAEGPRPQQRVDDNILAASQRIAGLARRPVGFARRFRAPVAIAATVLVTSTLTLMVFERKSDPEATAPRVPRAGRPTKVSPPEPQRTAPAAKSQPAEPQRADSAAKSPSAGFQGTPPATKFQPAEARRAVPAAKSPPAGLQPAAPATPVPQAAAPLERAKQRTVETVFSSERRATGQPARLPAVPRGFEILRKSEEVKPAPAAPTPGVGVSPTEPPGANPAAPLQDVQRAEARPQMRPVQVPAAAPAAGALSAAAVGNRPAVPEGKERTPEKWLEDIRKLKTEGKPIEAERELVEFKKRYPDYILPDDLR